MSLNFFKNINKQKINPATEGTLVNIKNDTAGIVTETATLITNTATTATNTASVVTNTANILHPKQANMANSMPVTIANNQTVNAFGKMTFTNTSTTMNTNAADPLFYLRKIAKQLESRSTMDAAKRQRIYIDATPGLSIQTTIASPTTVSTLIGYDQKMYQYSSRNAFADGIRKKLKFS